MTLRHSSLVNGSFEHAVSVFDRGFFYGDGVFRTMQVRNGLPVNWPFHYQKLVADCAAIGIVCPSAELLIHDLSILFPIHELDEQTAWVAKIIVTRGEGARGYAPPAVTVPTRVLIKSPMPVYAKMHYTEGVRIHVCETTLARQPKLAGIKHLNRLENVLARMEWRDESIFDGLLLDDQGNVIECTMSNLFARFGQQLITPDLTQCGVAGITRQHILGLGKLLGLEVRVGQVALDKLLQADEVLICNSLFGVFQVTGMADIVWDRQALASKIRKLITHD
ncbi:MAG: aminodeoxychorismate lyase [Betaproteobacteria bacterium HGW-Betaproteobacteria-22]|nr:MAG: aminodeoxychorismate lyase [Betaproteobacteria bacterium HGW-Betaproteobacteria-22]